MHQPSVVDSDSMVGAESVFMTNPAHAAAHQNNEAERKRFLANVGNMTTSSAY